MTATVRGAARALLAAAVRGRGGQWSEAVLAEFDETRGTWEAVRWTAGGLRMVWHERRGVRRITIAVVAAGLALTAGFLALGFRFVPSGSMEPTLPISSRFLMDKVGYHVTGLHHGDIVVFSASTGPGVTPPTVTLVKRVIGLPGDTITCRAGQIWRNGKPLTEPYVDHDGDSGTCPTVHVPAGHLYVLGDHRLVSEDSRAFGTIRTTAVQGRLLLRYH